MITTVILAVLGLLLGFYFGRKRRSVSLPEWEENIRVAFRDFGNIGLGEGLEEPFEQLQGTVIKEVKGELERRRKSS